MGCLWDAVLLLHVHYMAYMGVTISNFLPRHYGVELLHLLLESSSNFSFLVPRLDNTH